MQRKQLGVTLVELLIVVVIVGILSAIAYPSYRQYMLRGNRTEAKTAMMQAAQSLEKCFTRFGRYNHANCTTFTTLNAGGRATETGKYLVTFGRITNTEFRLLATPQGGQAADRACGALTLDQSNRRDSDTHGVKCW